MSIGDKSAILAERGSRWLALAACEFVADSFSVDERERARLVASANFYTELRPLLKTETLPFTQRFIITYIVLPFCQNFAPSAIRKTAAVGFGQLFGATRPDTPFPVHAVNVKMGDVTTYFDVLASAMKRTAEIPVITKPLREHIADQLEHAQSSHYSTVDLYALAMAKGINYGIECAEQDLLDKLEAKPAHVRFLGTIAVKAGFMWVQAGLAPSLWIARRWLASKLKETPAEGAKNIIPSVDAQFLSHPIVSPFIRFADRVCDRFLDHLRYYGTPDKAPPSGVDLEILKGVLRQQILLLSLCGCMSQDQLKKGLEDTYLKRLLEEIQERFALDEISASVTGLLSIFWETVTERNFLKQEIGVLLSELNDGFVSDQRDVNALTNLAHRVEDISSYMMTENVHGKLDQTERTIDKHVGFFYSGWKRQKKVITGNIAEWLGQPIKEAIADRVIPFGIEQSDKALEMIGRFWAYDYNVKYGTHYLVLAPLVR